MHLLSAGKMAFLKEIAHPKKIKERKRKITHLQAIQDVDERNRFGEIQHWIQIQHCVTCSAMDPLQWMGAARMRVQTADKNITIIHK